MVLSEFVINIEIAKFIDQTAKIGSVLFFVKRVLHEVSLQIVNQSIEFRDAPVRFAAHETPPR